MLACSAPWLSYSQKVQKNRPSRPDSSSQLRRSTDHASRLEAGHNAQELDLILRIRERARSAGSSALRLGIGDDCALLRARAGEDLAITTDLSIAGRHFRPDWHPPEAIGHRTLARGLSDLAAMGARPVAAFLSLGLPRDLVRNLKPRAGRNAGSQPNSQPNSRPDWWPDSWLARFFDGLFALADAASTPLAGGDLAESPIFAADIVLVGAVRRGRALLRSGARPGDLLYVTGSLGGAAAGLAGLSQWASSRKPGAEALRVPRSLSAALAPHLYPQPRLAQGQWLAQRNAATAALDISDGLSTDLAHLCEESRVGGEVDAARLPVHSRATLDQALHGGEDYELLFTAAPATRIPGAIGGVPVTQIGRIVRRRAGKPAMTLLTATGAQPLEPRGWEHFV